MQKTKSSNSEPVVPTHVIVTFPNLEIGHAVIDSVISKLTTNSRVYIDDNSDGTMNFHVPIEYAEAIKAVNADDAIGTKLKNKLTLYVNNKVEIFRTVAIPYKLPSGVTVLCDSTEQTERDLGRLATWGTANPTITKFWIDNFTTVTPITGVDAVALDTDVAEYASSLWTALGLVLTDIKAGRITTNDQIDSFAWP